MIEEKDAIRIASDQAAIAVMKYLQSLLRKHHPEGTPLWLHLDGWNPLTQIIEAEFKQSIAIQSVMSLKDDNNS